MNKQHLYALLCLLVLSFVRNYLASKVILNSESGCWWWRGSNDGRYGNAHLFGFTIKAHVLAYLAYRGPYPKHHIIGHYACDNTRCCSPLHLEAYTQSRNMLECFEKGRGKSPFYKERAREHHQH